MKIIILFTAGLVSGIISGMGIGGGAILIPVLTLFLNYSQKTAQVINLIYFIPTAVSALVLHTKNKNIEKSILKQIILFGIIGAVLGAMLAGTLDNAILRKLFGGFLLIMGIGEIMKKGKAKQKN